MPTQNLFKPFNLQKSNPWKTVSHSYFPNYNLRLSIFSLIYWPFLFHYQRSLLFTSFCPLFGGFVGDIFLSVVRITVYIKKICGSCFQEGKNLTTKGKKVYNNRLWEEKEICTDRGDWGYLGTQSFKHITIWHVHLSRREKGEILASWCFGMQKESVPFPLCHSSSSWWLLVDR